METTNTILWEEKNLTKPMMKLESNGMFEPKNIISEIKIELEKKECVDTGNKKK